MGQPGPDVLLGGNDNLWGGQGRDSLVAGFGRDIAMGQGGRDIIAGGQGDDICLSGTDHQGGDQTAAGPATIVEIPTTVTPFPRSRTWSRSSATAARAAPPSSCSR